MTAHKIGFARALDVIGVKCGQPRVGDKTIERKLVGPAVIGMENVTTLTRIDPEPETIYQARRQCRMMLNFGNLVFLQELRDLSAQLPCDTPPTSGQDIDHRYHPIVRHLGKTRHREYEDANDHGVVKKTFETQIPI